MNPTFILYLITLSATDGAEIHREPVAPARDSEVACIADQMRERPQRAYINEDGKALIDVYECVRRDAEAGL